MRNPKTKRIIAAVIAIMLVLAMVVPDGTGVSAVEG